LPGFPPSPLPLLGRCAAAVTSVTVVAAVGGVWSGAAGVAAMLGVAVTGTGAAVPTAGSDVLFRLPPLLVPPLMALAPQPPVAAAIAVIPRTAGPGPTLEHCPP
jgi:hypothetical protein